MWVRTAVVSLLAALLVVACDDNPVDEGRKDSVGLEVNPTFAVVDAADTTAINANTVNNFGDPTLGTVTFTACDSKITLAPDPTRVFVEPPERVFVIGQTLGASCVTVSAGSATATATVNVVPASIVTTLASSIGSGASSATTLAFLDKAGNAATGFDVSQVVFTLDDASVADVDAVGVVTGKAPGSATVTTTLLPVWGATRISTNGFSVVPAPFTGTIAPASANWGDTITITAPAGVTFDSDAHVTFDGLDPFPISSSATQFVVVGPAGMGSSPSEVLILDVGPNQLAFVETIDVPNPSPADGNEPNNGGGGGGGTLSDLGATTPATLPFAEWISVGSGDLDDVFQITLAAQTTVSFSVGWQFPEPDVDVLFYDGTGALISDFGCASTANPETCSVTFAAGTYYIDINVFDDGGHPWSTVRFTMQ